VDVDCSTLLTAAALSVLPGGLGAQLLRLFRETRAEASVEQLDVAELLAARLPLPEARARASRARDIGARALREAEAARIRPVAWGSHDYPTALAQIPDAPPVLWVHGSAAILGEHAVAIVGSRVASPLSMEVARILARDLASAGLVVVSGLARGIDGEAHRGAIEAGQTVAVLGSGTNRIYPHEHRLLADAVAANGAIVSELPPSTPPRKHHFPWRNRLISGLSLGVVVVEASLRSGSLVTARLALDQGREVLAVPGSVLGERHRGCHALLRDGAALVECAADVLDALGLAPAAREDGPERADRAAAGHRPCHTDPLLVVMGPGHAYDLHELVTMSSLPAADVLARLLPLELSGAVTRIPGGRFFRPVRAVVR
jgi:DNA processing protein